MTKFFLNLVDDKGKIIDQAPLGENEEATYKVNTETGRLYFVWSLMLG